MQFAQTSDVHMLPCGSVVNRPLPSEYCRNFKIFKFLASDFGTVSMRKRFCACAYEFLFAVTESVVHGVHKVVIRSSFGTIWQHKVS